MLNVLDLLASVVPVHKGDTRDVPGNYRPLALASHLTKIFEKVVIKHLTYHLEVNHNFFQGQHVFREGKSTLA